MTDEESRYGITISVGKCDSHRAIQENPSILGERYYSSLGSFMEPHPHVTEFIDAFGDIDPVPYRNSLAMEIGAGVSNYVRFIKQSGYRYLAIEPSSWAANWLRETHSVPVLECTLDQIDAIDSLEQPSLILSAHSLEHVPDAIAALRSIYRMLAETGVLYLIVPDDSDLTNPDHYTFFNQSSLRRALEGTGFSVERLEIRRHVKNEGFLYAKARKPKG